MAVRITIIGDDDIEDLSARKIEDLLLDNGIQAQRTRITRLTPKQYQKALS